MSTVIVQRPSLQVVISGGGIQGPVGPPGAGGDSIAVVRLAAQALGGHRVVRTVGAGLVDYADARFEDHAEEVLGLTTHAVSTGGEIQVLTHGFITEPSWAWTPGLPLFLAADGLMAHVPDPSMAFDLVVGFAETATTVFINLQLPFFNPED